MRCVRPARAAVWASRALCCVSTNRVFSVATVMNTANAAAVVRIAIGVWMLFMSGSR